MNEVQLIDKYLKRLTKENNSSQGLNDDIFFDKSYKLNPIVMILKSF